MISRQAADKIINELNGQRKFQDTITDVVESMTLFINSLVGEDEPLTINLDGRICPLGTVSPKHKLHIKTKLETNTEIAKRTIEKYRQAYKNEFGYAVLSDIDHALLRVEHWLDRVVSDEEI